MAVAKFDDEPELPNVFSQHPYPTERQRAERHMLEALRALGNQPCDKKVCRGLQLCPQCHAVEALRYYDPNWRKKP